MLFISALYFLTRLINLTLLPIFNDEAIYLDWGWREVNLKGQLFYSLADAKQPFLMWAFGMFQKIFFDPLLAGRLTSVITGYLTLWGLYFLGKKYFSKKTGLITGLFYTVIPFFLLYDRQALMESAIACIGVWTIYFYLKLYQEKKVKDVVFLGIVLGLGFFIKSSSLIFFLTILLITVWLFLRNKNRLIFVSNVFLALLVSQIVLIPLYLQSTFWQTLSTNGRFSLTMSELIRLPLLTWWRNLVGATEIMFWQITPPIFFLIVVGIFFFIRKEKKPEQKILLAWSLISLGLVLLTVRNISSRYLVAFLPLILLFAADRTNYFIGTLLAIMTSMLMLLQIFSPVNYFSFLAKVTQYSQKSEYVTGWTAGYGVKEAIGYVQEKSVGQPAFVGIRIDAGNPENAVFTYLYSSKNLRPVYFDSRIFNVDLNSYDCLQSKIPLYFVSRENQLAGMDKFIIEETRFYKPERKSYVGVYQLKTNCQGKTLQLK